MTLDPGMAGAVLLAIATVPQFVRLARTRSVAALSPLFVALNATGLGLLAAQSILLREWSFIAINLLTAAFWTCVGLEMLRGRRGPNGSSAHQANKRATRA